MERVEGRGREGEKKREKGSGGKRREKRKRLIWFGPSTAVVAI